MLPPLIFGGILIRSKLSIFLAISICSVLAFAQGTQKPAQPTAPASNEAKSPAPSPQSESAVPAEAPVITINGVCDVSLNGQPKSSPRPGAASKNRRCRLCVDCA